MIDFVESVTVRRDRRTVFRYLSDWSRIEQWDPGVRQSRKTTPGPVGPGSEFELRCSFFGVPYSMTYRMVACDAPHRIVLAGKGETVSATDTITLCPVGGATRIDYRLRVETPPKGVFRDKVMASATRRMGKRALRGLADAFRADRRAPDIGLLDRIMDRAVVPGMLSFSRWGYRLRKKRFLPMAESLAGRTVVVTGATSGIGRACALECARLGAETVIVGRDAAKVAAVRREIAAETGNACVRGKVADLALASEIRRLAGELDREFPRLHVLINNAGALFHERKETAEGIERCLAVNLVCPFLLTSLLLPRLKASAPARVVNVSSGGMYTQRLPADDLAMDLSPYAGERAYARAKRGLVVLTEMWAERHAKADIVFHAMHPGWVDTPGIRRSLPGFTRRVRFMLRDPREGADTIVWLSASREAALTSGRFWLDRRPHVTHALPGTRESGSERIRFLRNLERIAGLRTTT